MRAALLLALVLASGCALRGDDASACSDPLGLYTSAAYEPCCLAHDAAYRAGGVERDRHAADYELYQCVAVHSEADAGSIYMAVRLWGTSRFRYRKD
ncbi:MAG: hypothetical protein M3Q55_02630 [Acidobacteriota bacterium]|nr:hypothetical protein [Acidobacteriota bacterium]